MPGSVRVSTSRLPIEVTGRASVAPYGVWISASGPSMARKRRCTAGVTGAPADRTRVSVGIRAPETAPQRPTVSSSAGEPNISVAPKPFAASAILAGSARAGFDGFIRGITVVSPSAGPNSANGGNVDRLTSPARTSYRLRMSSIWARKCDWRYSTPFGGPVLPLVKAMAAVALWSAAGSGSGSWAGGSLPSDTAPDRPRPTVTSSRALGHHRRSNRARCALGTPTKASGATSARHRRTLTRPIPGSIRMGTAPILSSAKVRAKKSRSGGTISVVRMPGPIPSPASRAAVVSVRSSSSAYDVTVNPPGPGVYRRPVGSTSAARAGCAPAASRNRATREPSVNVPRPARRCSGAPGVPPPDLRRPRSRPP